MYLIDTNVLSEARKGRRANSGVREFFRRLKRDKAPAFISAISVGELRRGVDLLVHRRDTTQATHLEAWLQELLSSYTEQMLDFGVEEAQVWGRLMVSGNQRAIDKQIAATALVYGLTVVTRNTQDFTETGCELLNPFQE